LIYSPVTKSASVKGYSHGRLPSLALHCALCAALLFATASHGRDDQCDGWPAWQRFKQLYLSEDGRVIDASTPRRITVSEGQAYALIFALIANDPAAFSRIIGWTQENLAQGHLERSLPAWQWGHAEDGTWAVLDPNAASDADLWMAYALAEAGRLWRNASYAGLARALSDRILREEVALIPGLGATLLPGPKGFVAQQTWRLNASYAPIQVLRGIGRQSGNRLWDEVLKSSERLIVGSAPRGFAADWIGYRLPDGFVTDQLTHGSGSYNAIRVYLWAGMLPDSDPLATALAHRLAPMIADAGRRRAPPESINTTTLESKGEGSPGFSAALLPLLVRAKLGGIVQAYRARVEAESLQSDQHYYSDALTLFGLGWLDRRYAFDRSGVLLVNWTAPCGAH
jgi:endoglucanase